MNTKPKRRWYQFSLRTFFVLVTLVCVGFGYWVHWSKDWIRQRHEFKQKLLGVSFLDDGPQPAAPAGLWVFGEYGNGSLWFLELNDNDLETAKRLFPEAKISIGTDSSYRIR